MSSRNASPRLWSVVIVVVVFASIAQCADPGTVTYWLDRADGELPKIKAFGLADLTTGSKSEIVARLYELDPSPARLNRVREVAQEIETAIRESNKPSSRFGGHLSLIELYGKPLKDPARFRQHIENAHQLIDREESFIGSLTACIASSIATAGDLNGARADAKRVAAGTARFDIFLLAGKQAYWTGELKDALALFTWAAAELDSIDDESERDIASGRIAPDLADVGDFEQALRVAAGIKDTHRSAFTYRHIIERARRARQDEKYAAAYDAAKTLWQFASADEVLSLAEVLAELGDCERAREAATAALEKGSSPAWWFHARAARIYARLNDHKQFETMAKLADGSIRGLAKAIDQARGELAMARCFLIAGDDQEMTRRIARALAFKDVAERDVYEERVELIRALLDKQRWADAQKQIDILGPGAKELEIRAMVKHQVRAGEIKLAMKNALELKLFDRFGTWLAIAVEQAKHRKFDGLADWVDRLNSPLARAMVDTAVAEVLAGQPARIGRPGLDD